ncbi:MAG: flagellar biosynthesis protein FlhF [Agathobacter sp.]|nr:flagellar biosynthesis protein FlhF [Agathobacter sp.]
MTINKFQGKTKEEAIEKAKAEFGPSAVIMNIKEVKPKGLFGIFSPVTYEVTAAIETKEPVYNGNVSAMITHAKPTQNINLAADEEIAIPQPMRTPPREERKIAATTEQMVMAQPIPMAQPTPMAQQAPVMQQPEMTKSNEMPQQTESALDKHSKYAKLNRHDEERALEAERQFRERLDDLSELLEQKFGGQTDELTRKSISDELNFVRMIYNTLLKNEVNEKYINQVLDEVEKFIRPGNNVDMILPNIYQKLVLKFGQPKTIELSGKKPNVVFFIGPTGVGKTTTIAKIASKYKVEYNRKVAFITADTYRIAATEQLRVYANILDAPMSIVYSVEDINEAIEKYQDYDLIFVDTAGFSHKNEQQRNDTKRLLEGVKEEYRKEVYLVLSATTKYNDLLDIVDIYNEISSYKLIFTKLDETSSYGNLLNIKLYADADLSYVTIGQNVPDDIEVFDTQKIVKQLLGGK